MNALDDGCTGRESPQSVLRNPLADECLYRFVTLPNELLVLLVHDGKADKAAAACDVRVGSLSDPADLPGLAHFLEHMLFYSSEKYPLEDEYSKFIVEHGGKTNAFTAAESTNYHFDVNWDALPEALDRFAQFFICPLISEDGVEREANAVDSEHGKNLNSDAWKALQLWKHTANEEHPFSRFSTGSLQTLIHGPTARGVSVHQELLKFYQAYYCSQVMRLVVVGRHSLDELESMARECFSSVPHRGLTPPSFSPEATPTEGVLVRMVPEKEGHTIELQWRVLPELVHYRAAPSQYFSHLLGDEGEGSLFALLRKQGWATSLASGEAGTSFSAASFFMVRISLTDEGQEHVAEVTALIFRYLDLLRGRDGISRDLWDECQALAMMRFDYAEKMPPCSYASSLAGAMQSYGQEDLLMAVHHVPQVFDQDLLRAVISTIQPNSTRMLWMSSDFKDGSTCMDREPWYSTPHSVEPLPQGWLDAWQGKGKDAADYCSSIASLAAHLHLPPKNQYIPSDFSLIKSSAGAPRQVVDAPELTLWHRPVPDFRVPKVAIYIHIRTPAGYSSPEAAVSTQLGCRLLSDALTEAAYPAELAGLGYGVRATTSGALLSFWGYSHTLGRLVDTVADSFVDGADKIFKNTRFEIVRQRLARDYANMQYEQPFQRALYLLGVALEAKRWHVDDYRSVLPGLRFEDLKGFWKTQLLRDARIDALVDGNLEESAAEKLVRATVSDRLVAHGARTPRSSQHPEARVVALPPGIPCLHSTPGPNPANENSAALLALQIGPDNMQSNALADLVAHVGQREAFNTLRTQEQLGYIVHLASYWVLTVKHIVVVVQSSAFSAEYLYTRILAFLPKLAERFEKMPEEEFRAHLEELAKAMLEKPKRLRDAAAIDWGEIDDGTQRFQRNEVEAAQIRELTKDVVISFIKEQITSTASRRQFVVLVEGHKQDHVESGVPEEDSAAAERETGQTGLNVTDFYAFKRSQALYPSLL